MATDTSLKQPQSLYMLFFAEMWERFSFYGMRSLLTLYLTLSLFKDIQDPEKSAMAYGIYGVYGALVYATPFLGGLIADRILGFQKTVMLGAVLMAVGHFVMAIETEFFLYLALAFLIVGNGFFKPNISSMVGGLYAEDDPRRDAGFTIFYMGINLGALAAPLLCGFIGETYGWFYGFGLAGIGMLIGLFVFGNGRKKLEDNGLPPNIEKLKEKVAGITRETWVYILGTLSVGLFALMVRNYEITLRYILEPFSILVILSLFVMSFKLEKVHKQRLWVVLVLLAFNVVFWAFFEQAGSSLTLFTNSNVDRSIFGWEIPASTFQSVNPSFIVLLAPLFSKLWVNLAKKGKDPSVAVKMGLGIIQLGIGFLILVAGVQFMGVGAVAALVPLIFLIMGYLLHTTGELCLSPVGLSMVTKLAQKKMVAMIMGGWFLSVALGHALASVIASSTSLSGGEDLQAGQFAVDNGLILADEMSNYSIEALKSLDQLTQYSDVFFQVGVIAIVVGVVLLAISPILKKWMHGIH